MATTLNPIPQTNHRRAPREPRALVCASALVMTEGKPATEHIVYDLSVRGVRLCGLPRAQVGDEVRVRLQLPRAWVGARGHLLRVGSIAGKPDFAIELFDLSADAEDAIRNTVVEALSHPGRRSLLLVQSERNPYWPGWSWLDPVSPICATATTPLEAVECLREHRFDVCLVGSGDRGTQDLEWIEKYPEVYWRTLDDAGCLHHISRQTCFESCIVVL